MLPLPAFLLSLGVIAPVISIKTTGIPKYFGKISKQ